MKKIKDHSQRAHSILGASSASRWMNCPGSVKANETAPPRKESEAAAEGTFAHEFFEKCLNENAPAKKFLGETFGSKKFKVDDDMAKHIQSCLDYVNDIKTNDTTMLVEQRFNLKAHELFFGTNDVILYEDFGDLHVLDLKYGVGVSVEVKDNYQLMYYGIGALEIGDFDKVVLHVLQPRAFHPDGPMRKWETTVSHLREFEKKLVEGAEKTLEDNAPLVPGDWCRWCNNRPYCSEVQKQAQEIAKIDFKDDTPLVPDAKTLSTEQMVKIFNNKKLIMDLVDSCKKILGDRLKEGEEIEGVKLVSKKRSKKWISEDEVIQRFEPDLGEDLFETKILSPAKLIKLVGESEAREYFENVDNGSEIAPITDKRIPVAISPQKEFEKID